MMGQSPLDQAQSLLAAGQAPRARELLRFALLRNSKDPALLRGLAAAELACGEVTGAIRAGERAIAAAPEDLASIDALGRILLESGDADGAWAVYERGVATLPTRAEPYWLWIQAAIRTGCIPQAVKAGRLGVEALPQSRDLVELLCYAMNFDDATDPDEHAGLHRRLGDLVHGARAAATRLPAPAFANTPDPGRRLRVALLSGDVCFHACAFFLAALVSGVDRERVELVMYAANEMDDTSRAFARTLPYWDCSRAGADEICARARTDGVDVLIECSGWTKHGRLPALTPRAAPVQVSWLGYPNTTGLPEMDWRVVDALTDPPGAESWHREQLLRLEGCFVCYQAAAETPPEGMSEHLSGAGTPLTFGSFSRLAKVQEGCMRLWARVLANSPGARLMLKTDASRAARREAERRWVSAGGEASRLVWAPFEPDPAKHLEAYRQVDIALDAWPYHGTTTTCEAMLMGVPVVTLAGRVHRSRVGMSLLAGVGVPELVAQDADEFVRIATSLAGDLPRLTEYHRTLRRRMLASPLCDARGFGRRFEGALRRAWSAWCAGRSGGGTIGP
ncbi:MAG: hypothetical protein DYG92_03025 [Leptolyngbya sp. PLA1]|nr:hypothetical protein [Leptolyngbya sp. PLA1]